MPNGRRPMHELDGLAKHCARCATCFSHMMTKLADRPSDAGMCEIGRSLVPNLPIIPHGAMLRPGEPETEIEYERRQR